VSLDYAMPDHSYSVSYATSDGTAISPADYAATSGTLTFAPGQDTAQIAVPLVDNGLSVGDKQFTVTLSNPVGAALGATSTASVLIDEDDPPTVTIAATLPTATESGTVGRFTVTRTGDLSEDLSVYLDVAGTATAGEDYAGLPEGVVIAAGQASATVDVLALDDALAEDAETVAVALSPFSDGYLVGSAGTATVAIVSDVLDPTPVVGIRAEVREAIQETGQRGKFVLARTGSLLSSLTVGLLAEGDAVAGTDYAALPASVTFAPGEAEKTVWVDALAGTQAAYASVLAQVQSAAGYAVSGAWLATVAVLKEPDAAKPAVESVRFDAQAPEIKEVDGKPLFTAVETNHRSQIIVKPDIEVRSRDGEVRAIRHDSALALVLLDKAVADVPVYFEVIDPRENYRYSNKTKDDSSRDMDKNPATLFDGGKPGMNYMIEDPADHAGKNDNRDPKRKYQDKTLAGYNGFQKAVLSSGMSKSFIGEYTKDGETKKRGMAFVLLHASETFSGDNYVVRATTVDPGNQGATALKKPFNAGSQLADADDTAKIAAANIKETGVITAWKRFYYEADSAYKKGGLLKQSVNRGDTKLKVFTWAFGGVTGITVGSKVRVGDLSRREAELIEVTKIERIGDSGREYEVTLAKPVTNDYAKFQVFRDGINIGYVGVETGDGNDVWKPDMDSLAKTYDDAYVEWLPAPGSGAIPNPDWWRENRGVKSLAPTKRWVEKFMANSIGDNQPYRNVALVVGLEDLLPLGLGGVNGWTKQEPHISLVQVGSLKGTENADTVNHELCHLFDPDSMAKEWPTSHPELPAHDGSNGCLMSPGDGATHPHKKDTGEHELSLIQIYKVRDAEGFNA
ncbi:MAG: hypothetical protein K2W96_16315, partial [Gemmataceae bacterium]|nr:hypothetical protein [Gemmataceae bacterium]